MISHSGRGDRPLVSVVMPSYNQASFIETSIASVLEQCHTRLELIVMDGGSSDGTVELLERMARTDHRMRWTSESDMGPAHAINKAMALARGTVIGWLNSDDLYAAGAVQSAVDALNSQANPLMVYGHAIHVDGAGLYIDDYPTLKPNVGRAALANGCFICQPTVFLKRVAVHLLGPLDEGLKTAFDFDWWFRAFGFFEGRIGFVDRVQASSRLHADCITKKQRALVAAEGMQLIRKHMGWLNTRWAISYFNEMVQSGVASSNDEIWSSLRQHLEQRLSGADVELLQSIFSRLGNTEHDGLRTIHAI